VEAGDSCHKPGKGGFLKQPRVGAKVTAGRTGGRGRGTGGVVTVHGFLSLRGKVKGWGVAPSSAQGKFFVPGGPVGLGPRSVFKRRGGNSACQGRFRVLIVCGVRTVGGVVGNCLPKTKRSPGAWLVLGKNFVGVELRPIAPGKKKSNGKKERRPAV